MKLRATAGFTLIEIIVVISLIAFSVSIVAPRLTQRTESEAITKVNRLAEDVRSAFDLAVLTGRPYRMVVMMMSGEYWLETTDRKDFFLADKRIERELSEEEEKEASNKFDETFEDYERLAGEEIPAPEGDAKIKPESPLLKAKELLRPPKWTKVQNLEWNKRYLGPVFVVASAQAEHHAQIQKMVDLGDNARIMLYFFPSGYVERAKMTLSYRLGENGIDEQEKPYVVNTDPYSGTVEITVGADESEIETKLQ